MAEITAVSKGIDPFNETLLSLLGRPPTIGIGCECNHGELGREIMASLY